MVKNYLKSDNIIEEEIRIGEVPAILFRPRGLEGKLPTIILYHGWSSSKEFQRLRGFIFASVGFQVLLPDAINHGERNAFENYNLDKAKEGFWETINKSIEESDLLLERLIDKYSADKDRIGVIGNSMGGFTAMGIFTKHKDINSLVVLNGSGNWEKSNRLFSTTLFKDEEDALDLMSNLDGLDPIKNLESLVDRPILLLHGINDGLVPIEGQDSFYERAKLLYSDSSKLKFIRYNNLNHFVTTNMMEESIVWFKKNMEKSN